MNSRNTILGVAGLAAIVLSASGCDPYIPADTSAPQTIGVAVIDTRYNTWNFTGLPPPDPTSGTWVSPYPQVYKTWADQAFPGLCNPDAYQTFVPSVCPVLVFPPRTGPAFAPFFLGNVGGSYQATAPGGSVSEVYAVPAGGAYVVGEGLRQQPVPPRYYDIYGNQYRYGQIRIVFNKLMNPATIQPDPNTGLWGSNITVTAATPAATGTPTPILPSAGTHTITYIPNSDTSYLGASLAFTPVIAGTTSPWLAADTRYHITGTVQDQQGNPLSIDVTVVTAPANVFSTSGYFYDLISDLDYEFLTATYTVGTPITPNHATTTGGSPIAGSFFLSYYDLPAGLSLDPDTGTITGTPTAAATTGFYEVCAGNGANDNYGGYPCVNLSITVNASAPAVAAK